MVELSTEDKTALDRPVLHSSVSLLTHFNADFLWLTQLMVRQKWSLRCSGLSFTGTGDIMRTDVSPVDLRSYSPQYKTSAGEELKSKIQKV